MKKLVAMAAVLGLSVSLLAGCGDEAAEETTAAETAVQTEETAETEETVEEKIYADEAYLDNLNAADFVEAGEYLGVEVSLEAPYVLDSTVDSYVQMALSNNPVKTEITDRAVEEGDIADISYVGKKDGVAFDGGTADNYELEIGSNTFIDGFEDGVIGMEIGETKDLNLTFPENYSSTELAGADVVFTVTVNKIYVEEEAQLNDEFVASLEIENVATVEEYRQHLYNLLMEEAEAAFDSNVQNAVLEVVFNNASFNADPEAMMERYYDRVVSNQQMYLQYMAMMYGMDVETLLGTTWEEYLAEYETDMRDAAKTAVQQIMLMQLIAEKEGLTITEEEIEADIEEQVAAYGYESADAYKEMLGNEIKGYSEYLVGDKVLAYLVENAKVTKTEPVIEEETAETEAAETETAEEEATAETETDAE